MAKGLTVTVLQHRQLTLEHRGETIEIHVERTKPAEVSLRVVAPAAVKVWRGERPAAPPAAT